MAYRFLRGDRDQPFLIPSLLRALRRDLLGVELASSGVSRPVGPCRPKAAAAGGLRRAPRGGAEEVVTSRSGQRIDRPLLPASCPVCGHVALLADGGVRHGVTCCGQVSVAGPIAAAWAEPLQPFCRSLDGHVRWWFCRWTPTGPQATLWTAGVRNRAASPVSVRTRAAQWPSAPAAGHRGDDSSGWADVRCGRCSP
jgi:hypothetical protein